MERDLLIKVIKQSKLSKLEKIRLVSYIDMLEESLKETNKVLDKLTDIKDSNLEFFLLKSTLMQKHAKYLTDLIDIKVKYLLNDKNIDKDTKKWLEGVK